MSQIIIHSILSNQQNAQENMQINDNILQIVGISGSLMALLSSFLGFIVLNVPTTAIVYLQLAFILATTTSTPFSMKLNIACSQIKLAEETNTNFYCTISPLICLFSFPISLLVFAVTIQLLLRFVTIAQAVQDKGLTFYRVHRWFKGLYRWVVMYITFISLKALQTMTGSQLIPAIVLLSVCVIYPIAQLILYYKFPEEGQSYFMKYIQFLDYCRIWAFALGVSLAIKFEITLPYYLFIVVIMIYAGVYTWKYQQSVLVMQIFIQIFVVLTVAMMTSKMSAMNDYYLDLYLLMLIVLIEFVWVIVRCVKFCRQSKESQRMVVPENSDISRKNVDAHNEFDGTGVNGPESRQNLDESVSVKQSPVKARIKPIRRRG